MRRLFFLAVAMLCLFAALLPTQRSFVAELGTVDKAYRDGLELYRAENYSGAIPKFGEVKHLFPERSEVTRLAQDSQENISEGRDKSGVPTSWIVAGVLVFLFIIVAVVVMAVVAFLLMRRRGKAQPKSGAGADRSPAPMGRAARPSSPKPESPHPTPSPSYSAPSAPSRPISPPLSPYPDMGGPDNATVDLSRTVAIIPEGDTAPINYGSIKFVSGPLAGHKFEITPDGSCIGRDATLSEIVITDPRISKRHVWIGVKDGRVIITDQNSRNGTFVNDPKSQRVTEAPLSQGDTVILGESDVARFEYQKGSK
ncbi:MAG: FHA domain-containing protein [Acidobacteriota bacterium]|nr:FHA domain-containing protein [Acidobacteriota bacterium]